MGKLVVRKSGESQENILLEPEVYKFDWLGVVILRSGSSLSFGNGTGAGEGREENGDSEAHFE